MITNIHKLNIDGKIAKRNKIGIFQEKIYGADWNYKENIYKLMFEQPTFISFAEQDNLVLVMPKKAEIILAFYNGIGELIKEFSAASVPGIDDFNNIPSGILIPSVNRDKHLYGFIYTIYQKKDYFIDFDAETLEFGIDLKRTRL